MSRIEERLAEDERRGDPGTARRRLASLAATRGYDPAVIERVARLSVRMGDWCEAGRWYAIIDSTDADAPRAIEQFQQSAGGAEQTAWRIPLARKVLSRGDLPAAVRARLGKRLQGQPAIHIRPSTRGRRAADAVMTAGCLFGVAFLLVCLITGGISIFKSIF